MMSQDEKRKRTQERKEAAKKDSTSIRFSDPERDIITQKAKEKGVCFSEYVRDCSLHGGDPLSPSDKIRIQNVVNDAYEIIKTSDPKKAKELEKEMSYLWTM